MHFLIGSLTLHITFRLLIVILFLFDIHFHIFTIGRNAAAFRPLALPIFPRSLALHRAAAMEIKMLSLYA